MFIDNIKIFVKAGNGGNGAIAFHKNFNVIYKHLLFILSRD